MAKTDWYRRSTWTESDQTDFEARLKRSRDPANKAQYLCIQAGSLARAGHHAAAIQLLNRMLVEYPQRFQAASAHRQTAESLTALGRLERAVEEYRAALQAEREYPNVRTTAWLDFPWMVVERSLTEHFDEALAVLQEFRTDPAAGAVAFPIEEYRYAALRALLAEARGERAAARDFARRALDEAAKDHSGLRHHPTTALVGREHETFAARLAALANSG